MYHCANRGSIKGSPEAKGHIHSAMLRLLLIISSFLGLAQGQCTDLTNPSTGVSDCPSRAYLCTNAVYYSLMTTQCPATCGRCSSSTTVTSTTCVDLTNPNTGVSDCPNRTAYCTNSAYITLMRVQCPRTCGFCTSTATTAATTTVSSTCADLINPNTGSSDCPGISYLCTNSAYATLMRTQCPFTCGYCSG